ncbi:MAG: hypothetical protein QUS33_01430, partial [Dehalococcoidia bacterium]|nr:hypothetical protein [Dehalococcoidia bacterium]
RQMCIRDRFCLNCHKEGAYQKLNPHAMLMENGDIVDEKCLFCHTKPLDRKTMKRSGDSSLKAAQVNLCKDCHPTHKDPMQQGHIGLKLPPETLAHMYVVENMGLAAKVAPQLIEQAKKAGSMPTKMVPDKNGQMVCSTCHNPHQSGVFPPGSDLGFRAMKTNSKGKLVSPVRGQTWCRHCHDF